MTLQQHVVMHSVVKITCSKSSGSGGGLQYIDIASGSGDCPNKGDCVKVAYTGWLESSGKEFDSSAGRAPIAFNVGTGKVIAGWDEGILTMRPGGKRRLSIPADRTLFHACPRSLAKTQ